MAIPQLTDMDYATALRNCGGEVGLNAVIKVAALESTRRLPQLRELFAAEKWAEYAIEVHALKSVCANLGLTALSAQFYAHEKAAKAADAAFIIADFPTLIARYEKLAQEICAAPSAEKMPRTAKVAIDAMELREKLTALERTLADFDDDGAMKILDDLAVCALTTALAAALAACREAVEMFDYDSARAQLALFFNEDN